MDNNYRVINIDDYKALLRYRRDIIYKLFHTKEKTKIYVEIIDNYIKIIDEINIPLIKEIESILKKYKQNSTPIRVKLLGKLLSLEPKITYPDLDEEDKQNIILIDQRYEQINNLIFNLLVLSPKKTIKDLNVAVGS